MTTIPPCSAATCSSSPRVSGSAGGLAQVAPGGARAGAQRGRQRGLSAISHPLDRLSRRCLLWRWGSCAHARRRVITPSGIDAKSPALISAAHYPGQALAVAPCGWASRSSIGSVMFGHTDGRSSRPRWFVRLATPGDPYQSRHDYVIEVAGSVKARAVTCPVIGSSTSPRRCGTTVRPDRLTAAGAGCLGGSAVGIADAGFDPPGEPGVVGDRRVGVGATCSWTARA